MPPPPPSPSPGGRIGDQQARDLLAEAFEELHGRPATAADVIVAQAVARAETFYGQGWKGAGVGSNNWGAVQTSCSNPNSFGYGDTKPTPAGNVGYDACFRTYPSPYEGAKDLVRMLTSKRPLVWEAARRGDRWGVSEEMYRTGFYEGDSKAGCRRGAKPGSAEWDACVKWHLGVLSGHYEKIAKSLDEPVFGGSTRSISGASGDGNPFPLLAVLGAGLALWGIARRRRG